MSYQNLTPKQIYTGEANYTLDDFAKDFRKQAEKDWGSELLNKKNKASSSIYQGMLIIIVFVSQDKPLSLISKVVMGKSTKKRREAVKVIVDMYDQEVKVLESLQMKMFLDNLQEYGMSDSLNLKLLNADFRVWLEKELKHKFKK